MTTTIKTCRTVQNNVQILGIDAFNLVGFKGNKNIFIVLVP